jgi:hypothetical protein
VQTQRRSVADSKDTGPLSFSLKNIFVKKEHNWRDIREDFLF